MSFHRGKRLIITFALGYQRGMASNAQRCSRASATKIKPTSNS